MRIAKQIAAVAALLLGGALCFAQNPSRISGTVTDSTGEPLTGVTVFEKGSMNGVTTDVDGKYSITLRNSGGVLVFSMLGFVETEVRPGTRTVIDMVMKDDVTMLEEAEVVAVGYGTVARRDLTGSVAKVEMDEVLRSTPQNFDQAIAGRISGVVVTTSDGAVGAEASITIRGNNSLTQSSEPLYVIDGFPSESSMASALNPSDIESVDVLKDASATAIYGARGANGVIVITTRKGMEGKPRITFNSSWTGNYVTKTIELLDGYGFAEMMYDYAEKTNYGGGNVYSIYIAGRDPEGLRVYSGQYAHKLEDYLAAPYVNWQDLVYRNSLTRNTNVSVSGGNSRTGTRYNVSIGSLNQNGVIINSNFSRISMKADLNQKINSVLSLDFSASYSRSSTRGATPSSATNSGGASSYLMYSVWGYRPVKPLIFGYVDEAFRTNIVDSGETNEDGTVEIDINDTRFNPVASARNEYRLNQLDYITVNGALNWDILPELKLRISAGYTDHRRLREEFNGTGTSTGYPNSWSGYGINASSYTTSTTGWLEENTLTYTKTLGKEHHLQALAGLSMQGETMLYNGVRAIHLTREDIGMDAISTGSYMASVVPLDYRWTLMSFLARVNYNYAYKYYLTVSARADGSSKFPKANRWGFFPSASVAWNFNRENFLKDSGWLSNGKLRFSWGQTGNNRTSTPYDFYATYTRLIDDMKSSDYVLDNKVVPGFFSSTMVNDDLRWETTEQIDLGVDLGFFDNRIKITADAYLKNTYDLLLKATVPGSSGYTSQMINVGSMRNKGVEVSVDVVPLKSKWFNWTSSFNIGVNRNTVTALIDTQHSLLTQVSFEQNFNGQYAYITQVGRPTGLMYGFIYEGTYKDDCFVNGTNLKEGIPYLSSVARNQVRPGDPRYRDINDDGIIDDNDRTIIGCGQPDFTGGWNNAFNIGNFDFSVFFNFSVGNDILNANRLIFENPRCNTQLNQFASVRGRYSSRNPESDIPAVFANGTYVFSSRVIEDGSFLRLKNVTLGYTLGPKMAKKLHISNMRLFVSADNLWTFTNYSGQDPEVSTKPGVLTPCFDWSAYARALGVTGGISISL